MPKLGTAYETLKDESKRRAYDLIYPQITRTRSTPSQQATPKPAPAPSTANSKEEQDEAKDVAILAAVSKSKQERASRWANKRKIFDDAIFELNRDIRQLQSAIRDINSITKAEMAEEAAANSWSTWILSPFYKKPVETEEEKERKARERIQRLHTRNFKERELKKKELELKEQQRLLGEKRIQFDAANLVDDRIKAPAEARIRIRREKKEQAAREKAERELMKQKRERQEKERVEREAREKAERTRMRQERERQEKSRAEREAREKVEKERQEKAAAEQGRGHERKKRQRGHALIMAGGPKLKDAWLVRVALPPTTICFNVRIAT